MITFVTLFLSLVAGPQVIEVAVGGEVARVELFLDEQQIGSLVGRPWRLQHDFGRELAPQVLLAVARDSAGDEVGRARQLINVPRPRAGATIIIEGTEEQPTARVSWQAVDRQRPKSLVVELDGRAIPFTDLSHIELPAALSDEIHLLTAEVIFQNGLEARAWTTFGGTFGHRDEARLTAFPVEVSTADLVLSPQDLEGKLRVGDTHLEVLAVEDGAVEILMVRGSDTREALARLGLGENLRGNDEPVTDPLRHMPRFLDRKDRFNVLATWSTPPPITPGASAPMTGQASLFPLLIKDRRLLQAGLPKILTQGFAPIPKRARHRLSDAVAAAGRAAATNRRPRAVILVVGGPTKDHSAYSPAQVRRYLSLLRVPLVVWHIPTRRGQKPPREWEGAVDISTAAHLRKALKDLRDRLDLQRIVWVEGAHLPQKIRLDPKETRLKLTE